VIISVFKPLNLVRFSASECIVIVFQKHTFHYKSLVCFYGASKFYRLKAAILILPSILKTRSSHFTLQFSWIVHLQRWAQFQITASCSMQATEVLSFWTGYVDQWCKFGSGSTLL